MEGLCPRCMRPVAQGRYCPHCGRDLLQGLPRQGQPFNPPPVEPGEFYTTPIRRAEPVQPVQPVTPPVQPVTPPVQPVQPFSAPVQPVSQPAQTVPQPAAKPKRVRKLPILLALLACLAAWLLLREEPPEPTGIQIPATVATGPQIEPEETEPAAAEQTEPAATEPEETEPEETEITRVAIPEISIPRTNLISSFENDVLTVTVTKDRLLTVQLRGLDLKDRYPVNQSDVQEGYNEYLWRVKCYDGELHMVILLQHRKDDEGPKTQVGLDQMRASLLVQQGKDSQKYADSHKNMKFSFTQDSITWQCTVSDASYAGDLNLSHLVSFLVDVEDNVAGTSWQQEYTA